MQPTEVLRTHIKAPDLLVMPGIFDGFSARLVEQAGFAAGFISGGGLSETLLGYSDVGLMGFELNLAAVTYSRPTPSGVCNMGLRPCVRPCRARQ